MKTFRKLREEESREESKEKWILPDYPEQVHPEDDPKGNWVTGDPPKGIDFPLDGNVRGIENTAKILRQASKTIKKERRDAKKGK